MEVEERESSVTSTTSSMPFSPIKEDEEKEDGEVFELKCEEEADAVAVSIKQYLDRLHLRRKYEPHIIELLKTSPRINETIQQIPLKKLFRRISDHSVHGGPNRTHLFQLLTTRLTSSPSSPPAMNVQSKTLLVAAMLSRARFELLEQNFLLDVFRSCRGAELSELKHSLDHHAYNTTLTKIYREHLTDAGVRGSFLEHITSEATALLADPDFRPRIHAVSDIDDTFVQSGVLGVGGPKYPPHVLLPGVLPLFTALNAHVVFITARPAAFLQKTFKSLNNLCDTARSQHVASVLPGDIRDSLLVTIDPPSANVKICDRKLENFNTHAQMFPESTFMWFGDSGQSDVEVGAELMKRPRVLGAFIQDVARENGTILKTSDHDREVIRARKVIIANNYVDVARHIYEAGHLSAEGLHTVATCALRDLESIRSRFTRPESFEMRRSEMVASLGFVDALLGDTMSRLVPRCSVVGIRLESPTPKVDSV